MGLLGIVSTVIGLVVLAAVGTGAYLYATDAAVEATITETGRDHAIVTPKLLPTYHYRVALDPNTASFVCEGYEVKFHIRSGDLIVRDRNGAEVYAVEDGKERKNTAAAAKCGATKSGGGILG